jgi:hypothetical protein
MNIGLTEGASLDGIIDDGLAGMLVAPEAEHLIQALRPLTVADIASDRWLTQHGWLERLNMQAHLNVRAEKRAACGLAGAASQRRRWRPCAGTTSSSQALRALALPHAPEPVDRAHTRTGRAFLLLTAVAPQASQMRDEFVMEGLVLHEKMGLLVHSLLASELWRCNVYPLLEEKASEADGIRLYQVRRRRAQD